MYFVLQNLNTWQWACTWSVGRKLPWSIGKSCRLWWFASFQLDEYVTSLCHHQKYCRSPSQPNFLITLVIAAQWNFLILVETSVNGHLPFFVALFHTLVSENVQTMLRFNLWNYSIKQWKKDSFIKSTFYQVSKGVMKRLRLPIFTYYHLLWTKLIYS